MAYKQRDNELVSFGYTLRKRIEAGKAVHLLNQLITGEVEEISLTRFNAMRVALNKCLPDLKAIELDITDKRQVTKEDIDQMLMEAGLNPDEEYRNPRTVITGNASIVDSEQAETE